MFIGSIHLGCVLIHLIPGALIVSATRPSHGGSLRPDELLLIYNGNEPASRELAIHYADVRGVSADRLFAVQVDPKNEEFTAADFDRLIREPIRRHVEEKGLRDKVRCLVTFYGLPIRVGKQRISDERRRRLDEWNKEFAGALKELRDAIYELDAITSQAVPPPSGSAPTEKDYPRLLQRYSQTRVAAWERITKSPETDRRNQERNKLLAVIEQVEGTGVLLTHLQPGPGPQAEAARTQLEQMKEAARRAESQIDEILARGLDDPQRNEAREWIREYHGIIGLLASLSGDINHIRPDETHAAVDSELPLLWWDDYPKYRWVPNTLNWRFRTDPDRGGRVPASYWDQPVLMVSRIDAPTAAIARRMINPAVAAEKRGLTGTVYIDARGIKPHEGHGEYDQNLRDLAQMLWHHTDLAVRLDNTSKLFSQGRCPETMLYCGWYSLRKYVDAFDFVPGAVGYHIASFEAASLKKPDEQGWCKRMLEDGITATLGPVAEPYLESFPRPEDFFGLLLTGRFTLAECYAYTTPFSSWMLMLLGDPLYRPFASNPRLTVEQVYEPDAIPLEFRSTPESKPVP